MSFFHRFVPIHLQIQCREGDFSSNPVLFLSMVLEEDLESFVDGICTVALNWVEIDPLPYKTRNFSVIMSSNDQPPEHDPFVKVDLKEDQSMARAFKYVNELEAILFMTPWFRMPPDPIKNKYNSLSYFSVPKSYLDRKL